MGWWWGIPHLCLGGSPPPGRPAAPAQAHVDVHRLRRGALGRQALPGALLSRRPVVLEDGPAGRVGSWGIHGPVPVDDGPAPRASESWRPGQAGESSVLAPDPPRPSGCLPPSLPWACLLCCTGGVEGRPKRPGTQWGRETWGTRELTQVVGAGPELGDLELGGPRWDPQDLLVAQRAPAVSEVPRDKATGGVITPTDATAVWTPARAEDPITAGALGGMGEAGAARSQTLPHAPAWSSRDPLLTTGLDLHTSGTVFGPQPHHSSTPPSPGGSGGEGEVHLSALLSPLGRRELSPL